MFYNQKAIAISVFIPENEIVETDYIQLYNITESIDDPSVEGSEGDFIAIVTSSRAEIDPSSLGESFLFKYNYIVNEAQLYLFEYVIFDSLGNIGSSNTFEHQACLVPLTPVITKPDFINSTAVFTISQT